MLHRSVFGSSLVALALALAPGCSTSPGCDRVLCGACPTPISIRVTLTAGDTGPVTVSGPGGVGCAPIATGEVLCSSGTAGPGSYTLVLSAPGHDPRTVAFTLAAAPATCCACGGSYDDVIDLLPLGASDAGARDGGAPDASELDASALDAGALDASELDAGALDAGELDAGALDAGALDAGALDAGELDAGALDATVDAG